MAASTLQTPTSARHDGALSRVVFLVGFSIFLVIALVAQTLLMPWRSWLPGAEGERSLIASVKSAVYTFMSYIP